MPHGHLCIIYKMASSQALSYAFVTLRNAINAGLLLFAGNQCIDNLSIYLYVSLQWMSHPSHNCKLKSSAASNSANIYDLNIYM